MVQRITNSRKEIRYHKLCRPTILIRSMRDGQELLPISDLFGFMLEITIKP